MSFPKGSLVVVDRNMWILVGSRLGRGRSDSSKCFFVIRAKSRMAYTIKEQYDVTGDVLEDEEIYLAGPKSKKHYGSILRRIRYLDSTTGKE